MNEEQESCGFVNPSIWFKTFKLANITVASLLTSWPNKRLPPTEYRELLLQTIHNLLMQIVADPQMTFTDEDEPGADMLQKLTDFLGTRIAVVPKRLMINQRFLTETGIDIFVEE